ncbi:MAG: carboxypeptidase regulatory-like domain-containing protein [Planctomycetes bacterium]|nr:carboxypeptidase regulatory-like domain-containing protein [Planctomycetota bacterium]
MRWLVLGVVAETALLCVLGLYLWAGEDAAPAGSPPTRASAETEHRGASSSSVIGRERVQREVAIANEIAGSSTEAATEFGIVLRGHVRDEHGKPIREASLGVGRDGNFELAKTSASGAFAVAFLSPGGAQLSAEASGYALLRREIEIGEEPVQELELVLREVLRIAVFVRGPDGAVLDRRNLPWSRGGEPVVVATREPWSTELPMAASAPLRRIGVSQWFSLQSFARQGLPQTLRDRPDALGELCLEAPPPLHAHLLSGTVRLASAMIVAGPSELEFRIDPEAIRAQRGRVHLRVLEAESGAPLAGAQIELQIGSQMGQTASSDEEGRAELDAVPPGLGTLGVSARQRESLRRSVRLAPGASLDMGDVLLTREVRITGRVLDAEGRAVAGAWVKAAPLEDRESAPLLDRLPTGVCDAAGQFTMPALGRRRYLLMARFGHGLADEFSGDFVVDASTGEVAPLELRIAPTTIVALRRTREEPRDELLIVRRDDGAAVRSASLAEDHFPAALRLAPGSYELALCGPDGRARWSQQLVVGKERLEVELP